MNDRLVTDIRPSLLAAYGLLQVAFYDKIYNDKPTLYIHIRNNDDKYSIVDRKAGKRRVMDDDKNFVDAEEIDLFRRAYDKYLTAKNASEIDYKSENELLAKKISEYEAKAAKKSSLEENTSKASNAVVKQPERKVA